MHLNITDCSHHPLCIFSYNFIHHCLNIKTSLYIRISLKSTKIARTTFCWHLNFIWTRQTQSHKTRKDIMKPLTKNIQPLSLWQLMHISTDDWLSVWSALLRGGWQWTEEKNEPKMTSRQVKRTTTKPVSTHVLLYITFLNYCQKSELKPMMMKKSQLTEWIHASLKQTSLKIQALELEADTFYW